jgi:protein-disulfide isomerase
MSFPYSHLQKYGHTSLDSERGSEEEKNMKRQTFIKSALAAAASAVAAPVFAEIKKEVRSGTELDKIFTTLQEKGHGVVTPGAAGKPRFIAAIDTQCPWCAKLIKAALPLADQIEFVWYPVAVLNDDSITQAAEILSAPDPWKKLLQNEEEFKAEGHRGLVTEGKTFPKEVRQKVWDNSKIFRRAGGTVVPLGVFKTAKGDYIPILSGISTEELRQVLGLAK